MARPRRSVAGTTPAENKRLVRDFFDVVVNQRNPGRLRDFVAEDGTCGGKVFQEMVVNPDPIGARAAGTSRLVPARRRTGRTRADVAAFTDFTDHVLKAFPDLRVRIKSIVAEGDKVVVRWTATGTHRGEFLGTAATGRKVPMTNVDIFTVKNGKITEVLAHPDGAAVLSALGQLPQTPAALALAGKGRRR